MGGIACVTPPGIMDTSPIKRTVKLPSAKTVGAFGHIPIKTYSKPAVPGLQSVIIDPLEVPNQDLHLQPFCTAAALDSLWVVGYVLELAPCPSWSGFMKVAMHSDHYERTRIETQPFINLDPFNPTVLFTRDYALHNRSSVKSMA
jgi:hypothetical protein